VAEPFNRRYALLGWVVWRLAQRRLRKKLRGEGELPRRRRILRGVLAVAALAALARVAAKRAHAEDPGSGASGDDLG
jgi:hypothetical protein